MLIPSLKKDKFVKANESLYFNSLFSSYSDNFEKLPIKLKKPITSFLKTNLLFEITQYHDKLFNQVFEKSSKQEKQKMKAEVMNQEKLKKREETKKI